MKLDLEKQEDISFFHLQGRIDSATSKTFEETLLHHIDAGNRRIVLDFSQIEYINSAGLRVLLIAAKKLKAPQDAFLLCGLSAKIYHVFEVSGFHKILTLKKNPEEALSFLNP